MGRIRKKIMGAAVGLFLFLSGTQVSFAATQWVTIEGNNFVIDSFHGVDAVYTSEANDPADTTYSCAAYVKKYYQQIYQVGVFNLMDEGPPVVRDGGAGFQKVTEPQEGDIVFWPVSTNGNNHSAIVKKVEGKTVTLIEQNYKTGKVAALNRTITYPSKEFQFYRLKGNVTAHIPTEKDTPVYSSGKKEVIQIAMDRITIPVICEMFRYGVIQDVIGNASSAEQKLSKKAEGTSYEMRSDTEFQFTLEDDSIEGWYLDGNEWKEIKQGKKVIAKEAYFTIYSNSPWKGADAGLPGLQDGSVAVFQPLEEDFYFADGSGLPLNQKEEGLFSDVPKNHWAYSDIKKCVEMGLFEGYEDGRFYPDHTLTRAEFTVLLAKASNARIQSGMETGFVDVAATDWYSGYINYGKAYLKGKNGMFYPMEGATREDVCAAVLNILGFTNISVDETALYAFSDGNSIQPQNRQAVAFALSIELISGFSDGSFRPQEAITRAQAAVVLSKLY